MSDQKREPEDGEGQDPSIHRSFDAMSSTIDPEIIREDIGSDVDSDSANDDVSGPEVSNKRIILQKFTIYNSLTTMYIVGSNAKESLFRIVEITDEAKDGSSLQILEDKSYFYTRKDMIELILGLNDSIEGGIHKIAQAYGLLGFIKFTKGNYLSVITKCSQVAVIGGHFVYHVDETKLIPLNFQYRRPEKYSDEEKLLSIFKYLDLGKTFYFSHTYDITNSLQTNFLRHKTAAASNTKLPHESIGNAGFEHNERFVWNNNLLKPVLSQAEIATYEWFQPIIHGFIDQANISIYGRKIYITIIARRSHHFAGARFLKRGVNDRGNVANEVETEQIVSDMLTTSFHDPKYGFFGNPRYTSFVQHRGSIPLYWTQDLNRLPKPPIEINLSDPFYQSSAIHFNNLFQRYGLPVVILNLIKTKEKQPRELKLNNSFENCIKYLNQFLPCDKKLRYHSFDMSKHSKKNLDVISPLQKIAKSAIEMTGFFHNGVDALKTKIQCGVVRTNCIDCLDRTNAAQFIICKEALSRQLQSLGFISLFKDLDYDSDLINILTEIFHDHGDTIAVQYGGSNLVNTMDSYRRINQWSSHTRDILNSIKRIYSNSFMDLIRQEAINLFLGNYVYDPNKLKLWEMQNDFALHNTNANQSFRHKVSYKTWYNHKFLIDMDMTKAMANHFYSDSFKKLVSFPEHNDSWFNECYGQRKFQSLTELFQFNMNSNVRYFPSNTNATPKSFDYSPFETRKPLFKSKSAHSTNEASNFGHSHGETNSNSEDIKSKSSNDRSEANSKIDRETAGSGKDVVSGNKKNQSNFKSFLSTKINKLKHYPEETSRASDINRSEFTLSSPDSDEGIILKIQEEDLNKYQLQFDPPQIPTDCALLMQTNFAVAQKDNDIYLRNAADISTPRAFSFEPSTFGNTDVHLYWRYVDDCKSELDLIAKDNYFHY